MRDAVADELAARARLDPAPGRFIAASLVAHTLLVATLFISRIVDDTPEKKNVIHVRLAGRGTPVATPAATSRDPRPPRTAERPAPPPPAETRLPMTRPAPPPPVPAVPPTKKASAGETLFGRSERPAAPSAAPTTIEPPAKAPASPPAQPSTTPSTSAGAGTSGPIGVPGVGQAGVLSLEGGPFPFNDYLQRMIGLVGRRWQRPVVSAEPSATVYFVIDSNGRIRDAKVEESSGIGAFDRAALRAVLEASPLPPLPNGYGGNWLGVHLAFH